MASNEELMAQIAALQAQLAALMAQVQEAPPVVPVEPVEPAPVPVPAASSDYGPYDANWTQEYLPIKAQVDKLKNDGNRYHDFLAAGLDGRQVKSSGERPAYLARFLVKPAAGFVNPEHEAFFFKSWNANAHMGFVGIKQEVGFISGYVWTKFKENLFTKWFKLIATGVEYVPGAIQPYAANLGPDVARDRFEAFWEVDAKGTSKAVRREWSGVIQQMKSADRRYAFLGGDAKAEAQVRAEVPGWRPDDGSQPVL